MPLPRILALFSFIFSLPAFASDSFDQQMERLARLIGPDDPIAVAIIYDGDIGDISAFGDRWRDRVESALSDRGVRLKPRRDLVVLSDDIESFGKGYVQSTIWQQVGAAVVVTGRYYLHPRRKYFEFHLKAVRVEDGSTIGAVSWASPVEPDDIQALATGKGNVYHRRIETVVGGGGGPRLQARLDRTRACYPAGSEAHVLVDSTPGAYLYLISLAADRTATLLYPNRLLPERPLVSGQFEFPPPPLRRSGELALVLYPLEENRDTREAIKVIASTRSLDFSFLPVPENMVFAGAKGGDLKRMLEVLKQAKSATSEVLLPYWVGPACEAGVAAK